MMASEHAESDDALESTVEVVGSQQRAFINKPTIKVYWNGEEVGAVQHGGRLVFKIASDGEVSFKYLFRSAHLRVKSGGLTKIQLSWDRMWGRLVAEIADSAAGER